MWFWARVFVWVYVCDTGSSFSAVFGILGPLFPGPVRLLSSSFLFPLSSLGVAWVSALVFLALACRTASFDKGRSGFAHVMLS